MLKIKNPTALRQGELEFNQLPQEYQDSMIRLIKPLSHPFFSTKNSSCDIYWLKHRFESVNFNGLKGVYVTKECFAYILDKLHIYPNKHFAVALSMPKITTYCMSLRLLSDE